ncbi:MAG: NB-ARC domain-containing protein, partial [Chloroflexota bacterium]
NGNLPESLTPFFGRQPELKRLAEKLAQPDYRLITLVGQGGIGKSRLAIEAARTNQSHFSDGAFFIPLAPITRIDQIPSAIGTEIGLHFQSTDQSLEEQLIRFLTDKEMLLIIDNMEHMLDGADLLLSILRLCPHVVLLVTSRHTLDLQAEDLFQIEGLPYPTGPDTGREIDQFPAIRLFCNRAHRLLKTFRLSPQNQSDVVSICRLTEGLPLALELAASWVRDFPLPDIVEAIEDNYAFLQSTSRDLPPQHRSIQAVLEYSWGLLSQPEQALLAALSLFRGRFSATSIAAVTGATPIDLIRLCNQSLVRRVPGTGRYELHELTRQFAAEKLEADPTSLIELERKHARHYLSILRDEREPLIHKEPIPAFERLQIEGDNISIAWERGLTHGLVRPLLDGVQAFVYVHIRSGQSHSMIDMLDRSLEMLPDGPTHTPQNHLKCLFLTYKGYLLARLQDQRAFDVSQTSYSLAQTIKDPYLVAFNHYIKGWSISDSQSELLTDLEMYDQGERIARVYQFIDILMMITRAKGHHHFLNKQFELAEKYCKESVSLGQQHQLHPDIQVQALGELGNIVSAQGHHGAALQYHAQALDLQEVSGNPRDRAVILHYLTCAQLLVGLNRAAIQSEKAAIKIFDDIGDHFLGNWVRITLAEALRKDDQQPEALRILKAIRFERKTEAASRVKCLYRMEMGDNYLASEAWSKAKEQFHLAIQNASKLKFPDEYYLAQSGYAYAKSMEGDPNGAYHHFYPLIEEFSGADRSGWQDAVILFLRSFLILSAVAHEQATDLLMEGKSIVDELLSKVNDHKIRRSMLENIPEHRDLLYFVSQL